MDNLDKMARLITQDRLGLLERWRAKVRELPSAKRLDVPALNDHIPGLLDELSEALRAKIEKTIPEALNEGSAPVHGLQRLNQGFDIQEVVAEYNVLRGCVHDLADANGLNLQGKAFHTMNLVFDHAIGLAVETYAAERAVEVQRKREEYLAFVAHDLRTPLSVIVLAARVIEKALTASSAADETMQMFKAMRRNTQYLQVLVTKVLDENINLQTEMGTRLERRSFDLWPVIEDLLHDLAPVACASDSSLVSTVPDELVIYADAALLRRVFLNLITNAIKYTPGGTITIGARVPDGQSLVEIWVTDNGAGISESVIDRIFDKGETDPNSPGGRGLGLSIVKTFVEAHGGEVCVESKHGCGSTFRITVPTAPTLQPR